MAHLKIIIISEKLLLNFLHVFCNLTKALPVILRESRNIMWKFVYLCLEMLLQTIQLLIKVCIYI
jgi:hypothetical protein